MNYVVCVKLTPDTEQLAEIRPEDVGFGDLGVTMVLNPWDEFAVEEALQLQERLAGETVALALGEQDSTEALKRAVAMGVESGVLLSDPAFRGSDAWGTAHILAQAVKALQANFPAPDRFVVLTGRQSVDGNSGLVPPALAASLGIPFVSPVAKVVDIHETSITVQRALDGGVQTVRVPLPAVVSVSKEINEPRYPNFVGIRKASRMQYPVMNAAALPGIDRERIGESAARVTWTNVQRPPARQGTCQFIEGATAAEKAAALVDRLILEKVI